MKKNNEASQQDQFWNENLIPFDASDWQYLKTLSSSENAGQVPTPNDQPEPRQSKTHAPESLFAQRFASKNSRTKTRSSKSVIGLAILRSPALRGIELANEKTDVDHAGRYCPTTYFLHLLSGSKPNTAAPTAVPLPSIRTLNLPTWPAGPILENLTPPSLKAGLLNERRKNTSDKPAVSLARASNIQRVIGTRHRETFQLRI